MERLSLRFGEGAIAVNETEAFAPDALTDQKINTCQQKHHKSPY